MNVRGEARIVVDSKEHAYQEALSGFTRRHHKGLSFLLGFRPEQLGTRELSVMCNYLVGAEARADFDRNARIDDTIFEHIKALPREKRTRAKLMHGLFWYERGHTTQRSLVRALGEHPNYLPSTDQALERRRVESYRRDFSRLATSTRELAREIQGLTQDLASGHAGRDSRLGALRLRHRVQRINACLCRCEYRARAGAAWAMKSGYAPERVYQAVHRLHLSRLRRLEGLFGRLDSHLAARGMDTHLARSAHRASARIASEFLELAQARSLSSNHRAGAEASMGV
jgi:hypothetical protein